MPLMNFNSRAKSTRDERSLRVLPSENFGVNAVRATLRLNSIRFTTILIYSLKSF